ncbi:unnamed protein product, partial [Cuscuta epithymum]
MLWHYRLGHPSFGYLKHLFPILFKNKDVEVFQCEICQLAKHKRSVYPTVNYKPSKPFSLIHSDIWGPSRAKSYSGARWFITFIDDHTRKTWIYLLKEKSEAAETFKRFYSMIQTQFQSQIQVLRTDNGKEYFNKILGNFLIQQGIIHHSSCVDTPQQNGIAERKNRHLLEVTRALMFSMNVQKRFWGEALLHAAYLINRMPSKILGYQTPLKTLQTFFPHNKIFTELPHKVFGCISFVHNHAINRSKLDPRAIKCIFLGVSNTQKGYKCFDVSSGKMFVSMDVTFFENQPFFNKTSLQGEHLVNDEDKFWKCNVLPLPVFNDQTELANDKHTITNNSTPHKESATMRNMAPTTELRVYSRRKERKKVIPQLTDAQPIPTPSPAPGNTLILHPTLEKNQVFDHNNLNPTSESVFVPNQSDLNEPIAIRKGVRECTKHPISNYVSYHNLSPKFKAFTTSITDDETPKTIHEALSIPKWREAVLEEMRALEKNQTWELTKLPPNKHLVDSKWIFTIKYNSDGTIERYKARLVARGFTQTYGLDYEETFAPVAKLNTVRILLSLAANLDWPLLQLDVKNAFLNGDLEEEVFMQVPPGFDSNTTAGKVCKLKKALYGLKQSPRAWFGRFEKTVKKRGYTQAQSDHTLFYKHSAEGKVAVLIVYVDDIVLTGDDQGELAALKNFLAQQFEIKDLGNLKYFLGMEVARSQKGIMICQRKYVLDLLKETGLLGCKPVSTPIDPNQKFGRTGKEEVVDKTKYQQLVGKL